MTPGQSLGPEFRPKGRGIYQKRLNQIVPLLFIGYFCRMKNLIIALFTLCFFSLHAQVSNEIKAADVIAMNAPDSCQASVDALGRYFSKAFKDPAFRLRAIYTWTSLNISYDAGNMGKVTAATPFDDLVAKTISDRKAICQGYASVFKALCDVCGIKAFIVNGYTRQNGHINDMSHAWVIAAIDTSYYGFDPTWGAGYVNNMNYVKRSTDQFYMIRPADLIKDHMPFDPMWECLNYPISNQDFINVNTLPSASAAFFAYADSITAYQALSSKQQCMAALRRIESSGIANNLIKEWSDYLRDCISNENNNAISAIKNKTTKQFNDAVASYNNCIYAFNQYADYWNRGFNPSKPDADIIGMLDLCYDYLNSCRKSLDQVVAADANMKESIVQLQLAIDVAKDNLDKQKVFLKIYFNSDPASRPMLFKNYNGAGFPKSK